MTIEKMKHSHVLEVAAIEQAVFSDGWSEKAVSDTLEQANAMCLTVWDEDSAKVLGYILAYQAGFDCEIARIAVEPDYRRQGIAGELLTALETWCQEEQMEGILLDVRCTNEPAVACYKKQGYAVDGIRKGYYVEPGTGAREDAVLMSKRFM